MARSIIGVSCNEVERKMYEEYAQQRGISMSALAKICMNFTINRDEELESRRQELTAEAAEIRRMFNIPKPKLSDFTHEA